MNDPTTEPHDSRPRLIPHGPIRTPAIVLGVLLGIGLLSVTPILLGRTSHSLSAETTDAYRDSLVAEIQQLEKQLALPGCGPVAIVDPDVAQRVPQVVPPLATPPTSGLPAEPAPILPPQDPAQTPLPSSNPRDLGEGETDSDVAGPQSLQDLIDTATVLVIAQRQQGDRTSTAFGTGFFVSENHILTNRHVIAEVMNVPIYIGSRSLGRLYQAEIVATSPSQEFGQRDFALLHVSEVIGQTPLTFTPSLQRMQNVVAAGFPGVIMDTDPRFIALQRGLQNALQGANLPPNVSTLGRVMAVQPRTQGMDVILHRATISPGNSGGPLLDECGRLVGVNTFLNANIEAGDAIFYALGSVDTLRFLSENGVTPMQSDGLCVGDSADDAPLNAPSDTDIDLDQDAPHDEPSQDAPEQESEGTE